MQINTSAPIVCHRVLCIQYASPRERTCDMITGLMSRGVVPIVNENDAVAFEPADGDTSVAIDIVDNDGISAVLARQLECDLMLLISNGLWQTSPHQFFESFSNPFHDNVFMIMNGIMIALPNPVTHHSNEVTHSLAWSCFFCFFLIFFYIYVHADSSDGLCTPKPKFDKIDIVSHDAFDSIEYDGQNSHRETGSVKAKVEAAVYAAKGGVPTVIADGLRYRSILEIIAGRDVGTCFFPSGFV